MIAFAPVQRPLDILTQGNRIDIVQKIEAFDDVVVLPQRLPGLILARIGTQLTDNDALSGGL
jgi:hypothetical protein